MQLVGVQDMEVSADVAKADFPRARSLVIEMLVEELDGVFPRVERRQKRVRIGGVRVVQMHDARSVRRRGPNVGRALLERNAPLSVGRHDQQGVAGRNDPRARPLTCTPSLVGQGQADAVFGAENVLHGLLAGGSLQANGPSHSTSSVMCANATSMFASRNG